MTNGQRGRRGKWIARQELVLAGFIVFVVTPVLVIGAPGYMGGGPYEGTGWLAELGPRLPLVAFAVQLLALGWMVRIYRADPEPDHDHWRYRSAR